MRRSGDQALDQALAFHREPGDLAAVRHLDLPGDLQTVLRIAAGDSEAILLSAQRTDESPEALREVAIFYLQQLLFADQGDSYRVLGVNPDAADEQIKLHYRLLVRWLHPDRNSDEWESVFADRVNRAWQDLRTPTRRNAYDLVRHSEQPQPLMPIRENGLPPVRMLVTPPVLSARTVRRLPTIILSGFGLFAVVALGLLYKLQTPDHETNNPVATSIPVETTDTVSAVAVAAVNLPPAPSAVQASDKTPVAPAPTPLLAVAAPVEMAMSAPAQSPPVAEVASEPAPKRLPDKPNEIAIATMSTDKRPARRAIVVAPSTAAIPVPNNVSNPTLPRASNRARMPQAAAPENVSMANAGATPSSSNSLQSRHDDRNLIDDRIAASLVYRFSQAYANGDTERLMQLFTRDAQDGRGDRRAIAEDYRRLFDASERRRIALSDMSWLSMGDGATIIASFETEVVPRGKSHGEHASGDIRFDLREENGELRIYRVSHDNRRS